MNDLPSWYLEAIGEKEPDPPKEVIPPWDMTGTDGMKMPEPKKIDSLGWVTCRECDNTGKRYKVIKEDKSVSWDYHCDKLDRRVTPWFHCPWSDAIRE